MFPLQKLDLSDFERRLKKLVYEDDYISVLALVEVFKTCKGLEDIENSTSLTISLLTSDFLKKDN